MVMSPRRTNTTSLYNEHLRTGRVVKKRFGAHFDFYEREYRCGRDPYKRELRRHNQTWLNRRFLGYLAGVRDPDETPAWVDVVQTNGKAPPVLKCPPRARPH